MILQLDLPGETTKVLEFALSLSRCVQNHANRLSEQLRLPIPVIMWWALFFLSLQVGILGGAQRPKG